MGPTVRAVLCMPLYCQTYLQYDLHPGTYLLALDRGGGASETQTADLQVLTCRGNKQSPRRIGRLTGGVPKGTFLHTTQVW